MHYGAIEDVESTFNLPACVLQPSRLWSIPPHPLSPLASLHLPACNVQPYNLQRATISGSAIVIRRWVISMLPSAMILSPMHEIMVTISRPCGSM